jgi:hypothetical protein
MATTEIEPAIFLLVVRQELRYRVPWSMCYLPRNISYVDDLASAVWDQKSDTLVRCVSNA